MKRLSAILFLICFTSFLLPAQNKSGGINLSLWKGVSTQPSDESQRTWLNLGIGSEMYRVSGISLNVVHSSVKTEMTGIQLSGLANITGGSMSGLQVSSIANINGDNLTGISLSGLVNISGNSVRGIILSGMANISGDNTRGITASGLINIAGDNLTGVQLSGLGNITGTSIKGLSMSGLLNIAGEDLSGIQFTGLGNITVSNMRGVQVSGLGNLVADNMHGIQLAPLNYTGFGKGLQIGLVNYYKDEFRGFQLGLVNLNPATKVQLMLYGGNNTKFNIGARFKNRLFYTILGGGYQYFDLDDKFSLATSYRAGLELPLYKKLFLSGDLGYQHVENFNNKNETTPARMYALQARLNLEYKFTGRFALFATGGYGLDRYYNKSKNYDNNPIFEAGIVLF